MKVALVVHRVKDTLLENFETIKKYIIEAARLNVDIILFSEAALTGLKNSDNPEKDIQLGIEIPSNITDELCNFAKDNKIYIALGLFEKENNNLYDTAIFISKNGKIEIKYRRISSGWYDSNLKDSIYKEGERIYIYESDFGKFCFLICGDLFNDNLVNEVKKLNADYLLFPFARSFYDGSFSQSRWDKEEINEYINQIKKTNTITLATNYIDDEYFGGAFIVTANGSLISSLKIGKEGMLINNI